MGGVEAAKAPPEENGTLTTRASGAADIDNMMDKALLLRLGLGA
jgi:hypothetical protein